MIIVKGFKWKHSNKTITYTKQLLDQETYKVASDGDARPELSEAWQYMGVIFKLLKPDIIDRSARVIITDMEIRYWKEEQGYLIEKVRMKGKACKGDEDIMVDSGWCRIWNGNIDAEKAIFELVKEIGLFALGVRAQTRFEFAEDIEKQMKQVNVSLSKEAVNSL